MAESSQSGPQVRRRKADLCRHAEAEFSSASRRPAAGRQCELADLGRMTAPAAKLTAGNLAQAIAAPQGAHVTTVIGLCLCTSRAATSPLTGGPGSSSAPSSRSQNAQPRSGMARIPGGIAHLAAVSW